MSLLAKSISALKSYGLAGLSRRTLLYLTRRLEWRSTQLSKKLDFQISVEELLRGQRALIERNEPLRNRHANQRCFIIGNGPSINSQDLSLLAGELTFVSNAFCKHPVLNEWQPAYYFLSDPEYFEGTSAARDFFQQLNSSVDPLAYFVPHQATALLEKEPLLDRTKTHYVAFAGNLADDLEWTPDFTRVLPGVRTVAQFAIMGAMFMGCNPIYLLGLDHDWLAQLDEHKNFYTGPGMKQERTRQDWNYGDLMDAVSVMWRGYQSIQRVAKTRDVRIVNITRGGFLDVFERGNYEVVLAETVTA